MPKGVHNGHLSGSKHGRWAGGRQIDSQGYVKMHVGKGHPLANCQGYAYEHRVVLASAGVDLPDGMVVHHLNGDKHDNRLQNLELLTPSEHAREHMARRKRDRLGRMKKAA